MKYILYIPGFNSRNDDSTSFKMISQEFEKDWIVKCLEYDNFNPEKALIALQHEIDEVNTADNTVVLVGQSLGGYWANNISAMYQLPVVLINPCIEPQKIFELTHEFSKVQLKLFERSMLSDQPKLVFLSTHDEIIDNVRTAEFYSKWSKLFYIDNATHMLSMQNWETIIPHIKTFLSHIYA